MVKVLVCIQPLRDRDEKLDIWYWLTFFVSSSSFLRCGATVALLVVDQATRVQLLPSETDVV